MYLNKTHKIELAQLINSLETSNIMMDSALKEGNIGSFDLWRKQNLEVTVKLNDDYGIALPNLEAAKEYFNK